MTELGRFEETHSHEIRTTPLVRGLVVWLVLLTVAVGVLGFYLIERRGTSDHAICALFDSIPAAGHPYLTQARTAFDCPPKGTQ